MKEYKMKIIQGDGGNWLYLLEPILAGDKPHYIVFETKDDAHQGKLSLGLGTTPDPIKSPTSYQILSDKINDIPLYRFIAGSMTPENQDEYDDGCCFSGCAGCPTYAKKMGLNS